MVALLESQDLIIKSIKINNYWLILLFDNCFEIYEFIFLKITSFTFPFRFLLEMRMKSKNFINSLLTNLIPPKNLTW